MKKLSLILVMAALAGCGNNGAGVAGSASSGGASMLPETMVAADGASSAVDSGQFLSTAFQDGLAEIQVSQLAVQKASNERVRTFAQRMVDQHQASNNELTQLAQRKNMALPNDLSADQKAQLNSLSSLSGDTFDRTYMQWNLAVHENDLVMFKQQAAQGTDADVRALADLHTPILKTHLAVTKDVASMIDPANFLAIAYQDGLAEIQKAQLALQKATSNDVRSFAQRMLSEHTQANGQIAALALQRSATVPNAISPSQQAALNELSAFSGADFDKAYMDMNAIEHAVAARLFRKQARDGLDTTVKSFAQSTLPVLEGHLTMAVEIGRNLSSSFLYGAYQDNEAELRLSHLALLKASSEEVRSFAQRMIDEHTPAGTQMAQLAQQRNVPVPDEMSPEQALAFAILTGLSGSDFDQAFMRYNERLHRNAASDLSTRTAQGTDADLNAFAQNLLPALNTHLDQARELLLRVSTGLD